MFAELTKGGDEPIDDGDVDIWTKEETLAAIADVSCLIL